MFVLVDGRAFTADLGAPMFEPTSVIESSTHLPQSSMLRLRTNRGDDIIVELPSPDDLAPLRDRPSIYLDQNHWSTLAKTIHEPARVPNPHERTAAEKLIELARAQRILLPMSSAHMGETSQQSNYEQRYQRALTIAQLSGGWQFRDPLSLRQFELRRTFTERYRHDHLEPLAAVTLAPDVIHEGRGTSHHPVGLDLPPAMQFVTRVLSSITSSIDTMLDLEPCQLESVAAWASGFQETATIFRDHPVGPEMRRRRTYMKFIVDLGKELALASFQSGITPQEMSRWIMSHGEEDIRTMPALGLFREVLHEKLSDNKLQWKENDLIDMMYLTAAAGYCDHVVGERAHTSHIVNSARRLGRTISLHRTLRSLVDQL